ncbi:DNA-directed RNA polymerase subunit omega [Sporomusa ovata DSM 2662]|jgi:DNA-directed RNA polymerase subunit omega|uniref:DNA-directed RNA polymerase subunit omega n=1 Tax=Sporomusa ovata TaxID=2378 RepID=A0A0U1L4H3_9FIRM|nr:MULTISPECIES: DNA-directed RNA polymerase subunit omega [Sporomusa]EQB26009.1 DNA-directed RNA polymerase subunit omega [Sporomusa ovata DSM 2662]TWH49073.1 DNA-directed RNA polymerase subunit omega [Sporomusa sp. KB1]CQR74586.1 DNA-directed RNA polymerase omega subunit [Sporomusa ovata]
MINPSLDSLVKKVDSKYTLVVLAAKRAREIMDGQQPLIECKSNKPVTIALEEVAQGEMSYERTKTGIK